MKLHENKKANRRISIIEYRMSKNGIARAAQALAPRVAKSFLKQTEYIHSMFDVGGSSVSFSINLTAFLAGSWADT
jgi:hypothetical protein